MDCVNASHDRHGDVYHDHIRFQAEYFRHQVSAVDRGPYNIEVWGQQRLCDVQPVRIIVG
jgi:hypothetical protein